MKVNAPTIKFPDEVLLLEVRDLLCGTIYILLNVFVRSTSRVMC